MQKFNPFRPGHAISPGMFTGRINEINAMERGLFQTKNGNPQHFLLEGERGIGKTSLMLYIDWLARGDIEAEGEKFNFIVLSVEFKSGMSSDEMIGRLLTELKLAISKLEPLKTKCADVWEFVSKFELGGVKYNADNNEDQTKFENFVDALVSLLTNGKSDFDGILILVDEADKAASSTKLGEFCKILTERLTRKGCERVSIILAGLPGLLNQVKESHESAPRIFSVMAVEPLEPEERTVVIKRGLDNANAKNETVTTITDTACRMLGNLSEGYPHFLQEFCFWAFEKDQDNNIDEDDVLGGAFEENGAIDQLGKKYYASLYIDQIGTEEYRKVLKCMAQFDDNWVERQYLIDNAGVAKGGTVDNAIRALKDRGIIIPNPARNGQYKLLTKSFAIWIKVKSSNI